VLVYTGLTMAYGVAEDPATTIGEVHADSLPMGATALETIQPGERIIRIDADTMTGWRDIQTAFLTSSNTPLRVQVSGHAQPILVDVPLHEQQSRLAALRSLVPWHDPVVGDLVPGQPAQAAGLQRGDRFLTVNGDTVPAWERLVKVIESHAGDTLRVRVQRASQVVAVNLVPKATVVPGATPPREVGKVGLGVYLPLTRYGLFGSLKQGVLRAADAGGLVLFTLKGLLTGQLSPRDLGGPILVGQLSGEAARLGLDAFLGFMALFSMNLAVLNLLPIPVLDGGHLLFLVVEAIRRKPLSIIQRQRFTQVGFFVLLAIMVLALANDITRVFQKLF
jgi:regulator of sigma E protease